MCNLKACLSIVPYDYLDRCRKACITQCVVSLPAALSAGPLTCAVVSFWAGRREEAGGAVERYAGLLCVRYSGGHANSAVL